MSLVLSFLGLNHTASWRRTNRLTKITLAADCLVSNHLVNVNMRLGESYLKDLEIL